MSSSEEFVIWKAEPNFRGTFSIIVTCFTTLGICVWSSLHPNIPEERLTWQRNLARKLLWMSIGVLVPEYLIYAAFTQYLNAREIRDKVNKHLGFSKVNMRRLQSPESDKTKAEYLLSGSGEVMARDSESTEDFSSDEDKYLPLQDEVTVQQAEVGQVTAPRKYVHRWTLVHGFYAVMGGFVHETQGTVFSPPGFIELLEKRPDLIPDISEESICDRSKSNGLAKTLLIVQVSWFCVNCINRLAQRLPLTLLEISTAAHAACSLFVYGLWWHKPLDVAGATLVPYAGVDLDAQREGLYDIDTTRNTSEVREKRPTIIMTIFIIVGMIYGTPHLLAWNSSFATQTERLLWHICTCAVVGAPIVYGIILSIGLQDNLRYHVDTWGGMGVSLSMLVYFPAHLYLIAASFRQLFHLPPAAFALPLWSSYFPHVS